MRVLRLSMSSRVVTAMMLAVFAAGCGAATAPPPALPAPPPASQDKVLLHDDFDQQNPQWRQVRGQWAVQGGHAVQVRDDARELNTIMFYDPLSIADAEMTSVVSMQARLPQFQTAGDAELIEVRRRIAGAGLVFRYQNENNFYMFRLAGEDGAVLGKMQDGQWTDLINPRAADFSGSLIKVDTPYRLRVRTQGRRIQCWINDRAIANLEDSSFSTGRVGLVTFRTQASFDSIHVIEK
jgi:hypothetical protein